MKPLKIILLFSSSKSCLWSKMEETEVKNQSSTKSSYQPKIINKFKSSTKRNSLKKSAKNKKVAPSSDGIKTETFISDTPSTMCKNSGGWGQPCSYDMAVGHECEFNFIFAKKF